MTAYLVFNVVWSQNWKSLSDRPYGSFSIRGGCSCSSSVSMTSRKMLSRSLPLGPGTKKARVACPLPTAARAIEPFLLTLRAVSVLFGLVCTIPSGQLRHDYQPRPAAARNHVESPMSQSSSTGESTVFGVARIDRPTVVFVHGFLDDARIWDDVAAELPWQSVTVELGDVRVGLDRFAEHVAAIID